MSFAAHRSALAFSILVVATGCHDGAGPRAPSVHEIRIEPTNITLVAGAQLPLRAVVMADPGVDTTVVWASDPSDAGTVSPTGVVTSCYPGGEIVVHATSVADPTKTATLTVPVAILAVGWNYVHGIVRPGTNVTVPEDSVTGDVELLAGILPGSLLACRAVTRVDVWIRRTGLDSTLARFDFTPPSNDSRTLRAPLRSRELPNGTYQIGGSIYISGLTRAQTVALGQIITIRNP